jgi:large subunit ribosomal protein L30
VSAKTKTAKLRITWVRSTIGRIEPQGRVIKALGLRRLNHSVVHDDSPMIRGMINKVPHLVKVENVEE